MAIHNKVSIVIGQRRTTIADVAKEADISYQAVKRLYCGTARRIDLDTLDKLCGVLKCDVGDLFEHTNDAVDIS